MTSDKPFDQALDELLKEADISERELIRRTKRHGWGSTGSLSNIRAREITVSIRAMEAIARALQIKPEYFAEWRLEKARDSLDPNEVGLKKALKNLERFDAASSR